ncbi:hypothetical protein ACTFRD_11195 [Bacillus cereus group sp. MYBK249-1]|jgi:hypothetical protein|uniref:Uncharacterized protein n=1 Tax=Bacillus thuringiensis TaxID=1428 RepID=A0A9X6TKD4_BACTU|nr:MULTISPECIES: hypothetical protein [Bacillus]KAA1803460.1 hypothetical protein FXB61_005859 [Bacillus cereus]KAB7656621.1 hypothetical protein GBN78_11360 [Bacillus sp. B2-WWTP-C-10-Post-4]KXY18912.1 hypothetical protein AT273_23970 [Bacillus cereus]MCU5457093.1 hypothetical protein [Bacillus cereus]MEB8702701.1 hypothetical protein [Bacillus cereus]
MLNDVMYSLKKLLDVFAPTTWIYDGVSVSGKDKPFITIEDLSGTISRFSKENFSRNHLIQVGVYADKVFDRNDLQDRIINRFEKGSIDLYDTSKKNPERIGFFNAKVKDFEPLSQKDVEILTAKHLSFITITIRN